MWRKYFKIKGIKPGVVHYPRPFNLVDFRRNDLKPEMLKEMYEANLPYIEITDEGIDHFYGQSQPAETEEAPDQTLFKAKDIVQAIEEAQDEEQARYFYGLGKEYKSVQKAFDKKLEELNDQ